VHTNTIENVFSVFSRGMHGVYQHCAEAHLHRYLAEFDFRYNRRAALGIGDAERAQDVVRGAEGKRLTYRSPNSANAPPFGLAESGTPRSLRTPGLARLRLELCRIIARRVRRL
jgi:hypothetical protein